MRFEGFGRSPFRSVAKSMVFTASGSDLLCPCGDARLARGPMRLIEFNEFRKFRRKRVSVPRSDTPLRGAADFRNFGRNASVLGWSDTPLRGVAD